MLRKPQEVGYQVTPCPENCILNEIICRVQKCSTLDFCKRLVPKSHSTSSERLFLKLSSSMSWRLLRLSSASIPISSRRGFFWRSRFTIRWGPIPDLVRALSSGPETQLNKTIQDPKPANSDNKGHTVI